MIGEQAYKGLWWLPSDESEKLSGTLTVTKGEASLELLGHFGHEILYETETEKVGSGSLAEQPRILGLTSDGKRVTLEGHVSAPYTEHFPGIPVATYTRSVTLIGKHFDEGEEIGFDEIAISASDLNTWTQVFALQGKYGRRKGQQAFTKGSVDFEVPDDVEILLARGEKASIKFVVQSEGLYLPSDRALPFAERHTPSALRQKGEPSTGLRARRPDPQLSEPRDRASGRDPVGHRPPGRLPAPAAEGADADRAALGHPSQP